VCSCPNPRTVVTDDDPVNASFLATILQRRGFSAEFFGSAQEALAAARSKALGLLVAGDTNTGDSEGVCATQMRMLRMNDGQEIDYTYHEERLLALLQRRQKLPATSDLMPDLEIQILAAWDLVRSCRMVQARLQLRAGLDLAKASSTHLPRIQVDNAKNSPPVRQAAP
jgi:CheY-like chemotaxis protein